MAYAASDVPFAESFEEGDVPLQEYDSYSNAALPTYGEGAEGFQEAPPPPPNYGALHGPEDPSLAMGAPPAPAPAPPAPMMMMDPMQMQMQMQQQQMQMMMMNQQAALAPPPAPAAAPTISVVVEMNHENKTEAPPRPVGRSRPRPQPQAPAPPPIPPFVPHVPIFTIASSLLMVGAFVFVMIKNGGFESPALNPTLGPSESVLLDAGAKYGFFMYEEGEWWRFLTAIFLHSGALHLLGNLFVLFRIGWVLEKKFGSFRIGAIFLISGVGGNLLSTLFLPGVISTAGSASLFGYLAVLLLDLLQNFKKMPKRCCRLISMIGGIVVGLAIGLLPFIDNFAHVGGFLTGLLAGVVLIPNLRSTKRWKRVGRCLISVLFVPLLVAFFVGGFLLFYFGSSGAAWCPNCKYISCVPVYIPPANGGPAQNWCDTGFSFTDVTQALGLPFF